MDCWFFVKTKISTFFQLAMSRKEWFNFQCKKWKTVNWTKTTNIGLFQLLTYFKCSEFFFFFRWHKISGFFSH